MLADPALTPVLVRLIMEASAPLAGIEALAGGQYAQDSTGFSTVFYERWFDQKHGKLRSQHGWVKLHLMVGTVTHVVTGAKVSGEADCPVLPETLEQTRVYHRVQEVSADKAYLANYNLAAIVDGGALPYIPFKTNSRRHREQVRALAEDVVPVPAQGRGVPARIPPPVQRRERRSDRSRASAAAACATSSRSPSATRCSRRCLLHNLACVVHAIEKYGHRRLVPVDRAGAVTS